MAVFFALLGQIIPLYTLILLGYILGRRLGIDRRSVAALLIYLISPVVFFHGLISRKFSGEILLIPVLIYILASLTSFLVLVLGRFFKTHKSSNLIAFATGSGNTGYFGLPIALALWGSDAFRPVVCVIIGAVLWEVTCGFYLLARGHYSARESFKKVLGLPTIYAFFLGVLINFAGFTPSPTIDQFLNLFKGAYTILGMMMIGLALSSITRAHFDWRAILLTIFGRFFLWPSLMLLLVALDQHHLHLFDHLAHKLLIFVSIVPTAANTVAFATELNIHPEKASSIVISTTLFALLYIPLFLGLFKLL
jgi:malate permease and related proteins